MDLSQLVYTFLRGAFVLPSQKFNSTLASLPSNLSSMSTMSASKSAWAIFISPSLTFDANSILHLDSIRSATTHISSQRLLQLLGYHLGFAYGRARPILARTSHNVMESGKNFYNGNGELDLLFRIVLWSWLLSVAVCIFLCLRTILGRGARVHRKLAREYNRYRGPEPWCFVVLAVLAFVLAAYFWDVQLRLSYEAWRRQADNAREGEQAYGCGRGIVGGVVRGDGDRGGRKTPGWCRSLWLVQTDLLSEVLGIPFGQPRRRWWAHQAMVGTVPWAMFVAVEGSWRRMAHWPAFIWLAVTFSLPLAQALFFQSILCTPADDTGVILFDRSTRITDFVVASVPTTSHKMQARMKGPNIKVFSNRPADGFDGRRSIMLGIKEMLLHVRPFIATFLICLLCLTDKTSAFKYCTASLLAVICMPVFLQGRINVCRVFRWTVYLNFTMYWWLTFIALLDYRNDKSHCNVHSKILHETAAYVEAKSLRRGTGAFSQILDSINDHPSVKRMGVEVVLSAMTMGLWAFHRGLRPQEILGCLKRSRSTGDRPSSSKSLVSINTDGVNRERLEIPESGVLVWAFTMLLGLGASTSSVLAAEMLTA